MRINTRVVWDIETGTVVLRENAEYSGPIGLCKGQGTADKQRKVELQMQQDAFKAQQSQLADLKKAFSPYTTGAGQGFDPSMLAAMNTGALNTNAQQFQSAGQNVRSALLARGSGGGNLPVGGDYVRGISSLMGARGADLSSQLNAIRLQNASQAITNRFNAGNLLSGNAATLTGTQGVAGAGASSALQSYIQASNQPGFLSSFGSALGKGLGGGLAGGITGGVGSAIGGAFGQGMQRG